MILKNHPISYPIALVLMVVLLILVKSDEDDAKKVFTYNLDEIPFKD